jgi:hypothetical protein
MRIAAGLVLVYAVFTPRPLAPQTCSADQPVAATEDEAPGAVRQARSLMFDGSLGTKLQDATQQPNVIHVEYGRQGPLLFNKDGTVVLAKVTRRHAYPSADGSSVYSEYSLAIEDVLFNRRAFLSAGNTIAVVLEGGALRFADGRMRSTSHDQRYASTAILDTSFLYVVTTSRMRTVWIKPGGLRMKEWRRRQPAGMTIRSPVCMSAPSLKSCGENPLPPRRNSNRQRTRRGCCGEPLRQRRLYTVYSQAALAS